MKNQVDSTVDGKVKKAVSTREEIESIIERAKIATGTHTDTQLAQHLGVSRQSISKAKKRLKIPDNWLTFISKMTNTQIRWLLTGEGTQRPEGWSDGLDVANRSLLYKVVLAVEEDKTKCNLSPKNKATFISSIFSIAYSMGGQVDIKKLIDSFNIKVE